MVRVMTMLVCAAAVLAGFCGCTITIAPTTQRHMAEIATQREFALAYARAAKTPGVVTEAEQRELAGRYFEAATRTNTFANMFVLEVRQTSPGKELSAANLDTAAAATADSLEAFVREASAKVDVPRPQDFGATALAIAAALSAAQEIADNLQAWWTRETERARKPFEDYGNSLKMPVWPEIERLEVREGAGQ